MSQVEYTPTPASQQKHASARQPAAVTALAGWIRTEILAPGRPRRLSRMNAPQHQDKYTEITDKSVDLDETRLAAHAAGRASFAASLHDADHTARAGVIEIDAGGRAAVLATLAVAHEVGLSAFSIVVESEHHNGGHVWFRYREAAPVAAITAQLANLCQRAGLPANTEIWPRNQGIRLPLGYHQRAHTFGMLVTQDGQIFNLDDSEQHAVAVAFVVGLEPNAAPVLPEPGATPAPAPRPARRVSPGEHASARMSAAEFRQHFNATHGLEQLIIADGAEHARDGFTCPCGVPHTHQNTLYISTQGKLFSRSPRCRFYSTKGYYALGYIILTRYNNDFTTAMKDLNPYQSRDKSYRSTSKAPEYVLTPDEQARRDAANTQRREQYGAKTLTHLGAMQDAVSQFRLPKSTHLVIAYLLMLGEQKKSLQVSPTNTAIAKITGVSKRAVTLAFGDLEDLGIGIRAGGRKFGDTCEAATFSFAPTIPRSQLPLKQRREMMAQRKHKAQSCDLCNIHDHDLLNLEEHGSRAPIPAAVPVALEVQPTSSTLDQTHSASVLEPAYVAEMEPIPAEPAPTSPALTCSSSTSNTRELAIECAYFDPALADQPLPPAQPHERPAHLRSATDVAPMIFLVGNVSDAADVVEQASMPRLVAGSSDRAGNYKRFSPGEYTVELQAMPKGMLNGERIRQERMVAKAERECLPWRDKARKRLQLVYVELQRRRDAQPPKRAARSRQALVTAAPATPVSQLDLFAGEPPGEARPSHAFSSSPAVIGIAA